MEASRLPAIPTVADLFAMVRSAIDGHVDTLEVEYDADDGHPRRIAVDLDEMAMDDGYVVVSGRIAGILTAPASGPSR